MEKCLICKTKLNHNICPSCGFDESCNFESYYTISELPEMGGFHPISYYKTKWEEKCKKAHKNPANKYLTCQNCGNNSFYFTDRILICTRCRHQIPLDTAVPVPGSDISPTFPKTTVAASADHAIGIRSDGTIAAAGSQKYNKSNVQGWNNIISVVAGSNYTAGLQSDGTVLIRGDNQNGLFRITDWKNIVFLAGNTFHIVGLMENGTVVAAGYNQHNECNVSKWHDIVGIAAGLFHTIGLKSDGTVVAVGSNNYHQCDVQGWKNIVSVSAGLIHTVGLKSDGTVVAVGDNALHQCNISGWSKISDLAAGYYHTAGLDANGLVHLTGNSKSNTIKPAGRKIKAITCGQDFTLGLGGDGTVFPIDTCPFDVSCLKNIKLPV